jgi:hypothetical protein
MTIRMRPVVFQNTASAPIPKFASARCWGPERTSES